MIKILKLSKEIINETIQLSNIKEGTIVSDKQANIAYNLYMKLDKKPNFIKVPQSVRQPIMPAGNYQPLSVDLFKDPKRIIYLRRWILELLPIIDIFSQVGKLPLTRPDEDDFKAYLQEIFNNYVSMLEKIHFSIPSEYNVINNKDLDHVRNLCMKIIDSIQEYYKGFPSEAFKELHKGLYNNVSLPNHFKSMIKLPSSDDEKFYKMRVGTDHVFTSKEMFHIPLELRGIVSTNRYSIPGLPCVYLGSSPLTCWEELNKPDLNTIQTSLFVSNKINYLDLSKPPIVFIDKLIKKFNDHGTIMKKRLLADELNEPNEVISYIIIWPLMAACSIRVKNTKDTFKPEYIIPQLLLQFIRQNDFIDGVSYFSTKVDNYSTETAELYKNFAFPVQGGQNIGLCPKLRSKFVVTDAVPWNMFQLYNGSHYCAPHEGEKRVEHEFINGMSLLYSSTDFSKLETFLHNKFATEKSKHLLE
ncbi:hypothetical protein [Bacillus toyonensis]|uniref:hypothetical protein n=1 Tax=Bacillus toyonensis TaxID=155322 RepID=UPI000BEC1B33|nr:hypothetical protein [Bacillus toyonensis]PDZ26987.1 hypothetical protein CON85_19715 [Bacillus toyonensis]PFX48460.1 hypothetical protein COL34_28815 [Bacillus toyonensis]PHF35828.1 hypothetical protein COF85_21060 [Bacillus toyonensis]